VGFELTTLVVISSDGINQINYHMIMTMMAPVFLEE